MATEVTFREPAGEGWLPIDNPPVGLITWYAPNGAVLALATSWLGIIGGHLLELRVGCCGNAADRERIPAGTDFTVNLPPRRVDIGSLGGLPARPAPGRALAIENVTHLRPARRVRAPLLAGCVLHIECTGGRLLRHTWGEELVGEILLLHRDGLSLEPEDDGGFSLLQPCRRPASA